MLSFLVSVIPKTQPEAKARDPQNPNTAIPQYRNTEIQRPTTNDQRLTINPQKCHPEDVAGGEGEGPYTYSPSRIRIAYRESRIATLANRRRRDRMRNDLLPRILRNRLSDLFRISWKLIQVDRKTAIRV